MTTTDDNTCSLLIRFEEGDLSNVESLRLFATLISTGLAWRLQGMYGRTAARLIEAGWVSSDGQVNPWLVSQLCEVPGCHLAGQHRHAPACKAKAIGGAE